MSQIDIQPSYRRTSRFQSVDLTAWGTAHFDAYIRLMEETEYEFLRSRGLSVVLSDERGTIGFPRLSTDIEIHCWVGDDRELDVTLRLADIDGKQICYEFDIVESFARESRIASGRFVVACCRFPGNRLPYAILIPDNVTQKLTAPVPLQPAPLQPDATGPRPPRGDHG